ncbi:unnamed protein product [Euphydryas editha]|uniref:Fatty acid desaturase domain-containing protein n=1 Tax=Euphydryas editha TaxID=104508 RepID=A0AAU9THM2_EUPED|nr:unnamed protein product [Euphydryas editha]
MSLKTNEYTKNDDNPNTETVDGLKKYIVTKRIGTDYSYKHKIVWKNAIGFLFLHLLALWGLWICITRGIKLKTYLWTLLVLFFSSLGVTMGAHRLFAHKSFKARPLLKASLIICQTLAGQNSIFIWCRDHRLHHRYSDTDGDPHNSRRGFFFCHMGWLMYKKHPYVMDLGRRIDMSDLQEDWMVMFQKKYYYYLYFLFAVFIPVAVPYYYFGESFKNAFLVCYMFRYVIQLNGTWLVNSAAHLYGTRPYDKKMQPVESWFVSLITFGEGWHNYHHTFPWDYKAAELSMHFNPTASFIRMFETLGLAYDLKSASPEMVMRRIRKSGDGTHYLLGNEKDKKSVTAIGLLHPLNPSYNVVYEAPDSMLEDKGLPLFHEQDVIDANLLKRDIASG